MLNKYIQIIDHNQKLEKNKSAPIIKEWEKCLTA